MFNNKYVIEMEFPYRLKEGFSNTEKEIIQYTKMEFNDFMLNSKRRNVRNKKYLAAIDTVGYKMRFHVETEFPVEDLNQLGKHLRKYSILALDNGMDLYAYHHRLMKAA